jgi:hypothetical protein
VSTEILRARLAHVRAAREAAELEAIARRREERDLVDVLAMVEGGG